ncbi:hypothetical protein HanPI659440_Chr15g0583431 [Helianthus annuus]|nr:hypothetical protein HanPI659440_Chr15g0583431 [Helianthus annuus]
MWKLNKPIFMHNCTSHRHKTPRFCTCFDTPHNFSYQNMCFCTSLCNNSHCTYTSSHKARNSTDLLTHRHTSLCNKPHRTCTSSHKTHSSTNL